jgi:hypothetical protein
MEMEMLMSTFRCEITCYLKIQNYLLCGQCLTLLGRAGTFPANDGATSYLQEMSEEHIDATGLTSWQFEANFWNNFTELLSTLSP